MNEFMLQFDCGKSPVSIEIGEGVLFVGSCFSSSIADKSRVAGLTTFNDYFGTLFHPNAISNAINCALNNNWSEQIVIKDDFYYSYDLGGTIFASSELEFKHKLNEVSKGVIQAIKSTKFLFVTFGTSWGYHLTETHQLVANCHKQPSSIFHKELTSSTEIFNEWKRLILLIQKINPTIQVVFTVSPVRHSKEGLVENNRSKSNLIIAINELLKEVERVDYFPSYELIVDVLRDYRFYKVDRVHPTKEAVNFVWDHFQTYFLTNNTIEIIKKVEKLRLAENHRFTNPDSEASKKHLKLIQQKKDALLKKHPLIKW